MRFLRVWDLYHGHRPTFRRSGALYPESGSELIETSIIIRPRTVFSLLHTVPLVRMIVIQIAVHYGELNCFRWLAPELRMFAPPLLVRQSYHLRQPSRDLLEK